MKSKWFTYYFCLIIIGVSTLSFYSFDQKSDSTEVPQKESSMLLPPLVQKALDEKLTRYKNTILKKCKEKAYKAAEAYIDSLVAEELKIQSSDTIKFPAKPIRPTLGGPIKLNDSTAIAPILKKEEE